MLKPRAQGDARKFRQWLVQRVAETAWVWGAKGVTNLDLSTMLGVAPDVIVDARRFLDAADRARTKVQGTQRTRTTGRNNVATIDRDYLMRVLAPQQVWSDFRRLLEARVIREQSLMQSLVHHFLITQDYPLPRDVWVYRGERLMVGCTSYKNWPWKILCRLPYGVAAVLRRRARVLGVPVASIMRNLVLDLLEGKLDSVRILTSRQQLLEPSRYYVGDEQVREIAMAECNRRRKRSKK